MQGKTHTVGGAAAAVIAAQVMNLGDPALVAASGAIGGIVPDICHGGSKIGRRLPILSKIINLLFGHRTFTHSLLFLLIVGGIGFYNVPGDSLNLFIGFMVGMGSHLLLDAATKNGIAFFYPLKIKVRLPFTTRTGSFIEYVVFAAITVFLVYSGWKYIG
ncbi:metal-dependent hydrolase [Bacillus atrophaeus]|uniref:metal-dependent hydrolase n=1 Tax=Bacillus atrophaeus TaxID=1452 RepID=UPI002280AD84|nr:metal-dependent hydrolase [Bacillus atrophaeus]MCY8478064.1 metal-dependent hydrolase [Bacillus atrophaeus]